MLNEIKKSPAVVEVKHVLTGWVVVEFVAGYRATLSHRPELAEYHLHIDAKYGSEINDRYAFDRKSDAVAELTRWTRMIEEQQIVVAELVATEAK